MADIAHDQSPTYDQSEQADLPTLSIWTLTFLDRQTPGAPYFALDILAETSTQAVVTGVRGFAAMGGDTDRWMPARVVRKASDR